jgi:ABC-type transport system involved in cytochrome c biogenesis permease component
MSKFNELLATGRELSKEERDVALKRLMMSPQAPALLVMVRELWEEYARAISSQSMAPMHGCLEHCAGSLHAMDYLEAQLRSIVASLEKKK